MMEMTSPVRTTFDIFNEKQIQDNVNLLSHIPRENATYVHLPSGTVVTRARLGGVDESPNINKIRRSLFRSADPFDEERSTPKNTENNPAQKTNNDSGFSEKYRDNSFAYYNRMFLSDSSDSEAFDFADDEDEVLRDEDDWVPMMQLKRKGAKLVKRNIDSCKVSTRKLTKRKTESSVTCSPIVKVSRCTTSGNNTTEDVHRKEEAERKLNRGMNHENENSENIAADIEVKAKDAEMISATMKFADLVFQFHNNVKLKMDSDCDDDMTDISEADLEELE